MTQLDTVPSVPRRLKLWLVANATTVGVCAFMLLARVLLTFIETLHYYWPHRLLWLSDLLYHNLPFLSWVFSHSNDQSKIRSIEQIEESCCIISECYDVVCADGHVLTVQRKILRSQSANEYRRAGPPVLLLHGLLQDSDAFCCSGDHSLVYALLTAGHDVWCGNNRGTKYSSRHATYSPNAEQFWDFNIDHLARYDVPSMVDLVLERSKYQKLALIGFSQGSAQSFAALSLYPALNEKVSLFVALAPAVRTAAVGGVISHLSAAYPDILTTVFGKHSFLPIVIGWQKILTPTFLERVVSTSMLLLFGWDCREIGIDRRLKLYQFVYSLSSVSCVSHWFHVLGQNNGRLCSYDSGIRLESGFGSADNVGNSTDYDMSRISCPVAVFSGTRDFIVDASVVPNSVQNCVHVHIQNNYEHLDMIWADGAHESIFPNVVKLVDKFCPSIEFLPLSKQ